MLGVLLVAAIGFLGYTMLAIRRPAGEQAARRGQAAAKTKGRGATPLWAAPADAAFARYEPMVKRDLFSPAPPRAQVPTSGTGLPPLRTPQPPAPSAKTPAAAGVDVSGWAYVGYVVLGGVTYGLLQNDANRAFEQVPVGGSFLGAKVEKVTSEEITLSSAGAPITLTVPRDFPVTPLSKSASPAPAAGGASANRPRQPAGNTPSPGARGGLTPGIPPVVAPQPTPPAAPPSAAPEEQTTE